MALPKPSTAASSTYADPPSGSETSPTTSPEHSSKQADSNPNYTPNYEEPKNRRNRTAARCATGLCPGRLGGYDAELPGAHREVPRGGRGPGAGRGCWWCPLVVGVSAARGSAGRGRGEVGVGLGEYECGGDECGPVGGVAGGAHALAGGEVDEHGVADGQDPPVVADGQLVLEIAPESPRVNARCPSSPVRSRIVVAPSGAWYSMCPQSAGVRTPRVAEASESR